jgi:hypothetical protein
LNPQFARRSTSGERPLGVCSVRLHDPRMAIEWLDKTSLTFLTGENLSEQCSMMGTGRPDKARRKRSFALSVTHINKALRA